MVYLCHVKNQMTERQIVKSLQWTWKEQFAIVELFLAMRNGSILRNINVTYQHRFDDNCQLFCNGVACIYLWAELYVGHISQSTFAGLPSWILWHTHTHTIDWIRFTTYTPTYCALFMLLTSIRGEHIRTHSNTFDTLCALTLMVIPCPDMYGWEIRHTHKHTHSPIAMPYTHAISDNIHTHTNIATFTAYRNVACVQL